MAGKSVELVVAVVEVIDDADVRAVEPFDDGDEVLGLAEPAAVVVKVDRAAEPRGRLDHRAEQGRGGVRTLLLLGWILRGGVADRDPELRLQAVPLDHGQNLLGVVVEHRRDPEGIERDPLPGQLDDLWSKLGRCSARQS